MKKNELYTLGIDIGSTTVKIAVLGADNEVLFSDYERHFANIQETLSDLLGRAIYKLGPIHVSPVITGSGGLTLATHLHVPFVQEVIAVSTALQDYAPQTDVAIELGGEDAKIIYFEDGNVEQRMNGVCAGGTGSFIDQMASLLQTDASGLNEYAKNYTSLYSIAARCGVFAKSDIQPLINEGASKENLAASIFQAVVNQTISGLACGKPIRGHVAFLGGPLHFLSELKEAFIRTLKLDDEHIIAPNHSHLFAAIGSALNSKRNVDIPLQTLQSRLANKIELEFEVERLEPLFASSADYEEFTFRHAKHQVPVKDLASYQGKAFLGIDAGSTTTKAALVGEDGTLLYSFYHNNDGDPLGTTIRAIKEIYSQLPEGVEIVHSCSTGYGEALIKAALLLDEGEVETVSHYYAAAFFEPDVDCILDIGGQDMKCIKIKNQTVDSVQLNEACSSGCGSFLETFAKSLGYSAQEFSLAACHSEAPCDLGTRCTVFMNSKVKQVLREGATINDIAAGLAYSVVKNCLYKVLKLKDISVLGKDIVVQGGTMRNDAVVRAIELLSGAEVARCDTPELMGAFGCALYAMKHQGESVSLDEIINKAQYSARSLYCKSCDNRCLVIRYEFESGKSYYSGNRCEKVFTNGESSNRKGLNVYRQKEELLFHRSAEIAAPEQIIGIPRCLNMYEEYPFWHTLFTSCGIQVCLSDPSNFRKYEHNARMVMSDNICFPAKLVHSHVQDLIEKKVDRIFMPFVIFERKGMEQNSYNCPIVTGYSEVIKSVQSEGIPVDSPAITFKDRNLLFKQCREYLSGLSVDDRTIQQAFQKAESEQHSFINTLVDYNKNILQQTGKGETLTVMLAGRPYHTDSLIQHKVSDMLADMGVNVIADDLVRQMDIPTDDAHFVAQWAYTNRILKAAKWCATQGKNIQFVEMTSFGCGPDAFLVDEVRDLLMRHNKSLTLLKLDDINNIGSMKLRVRSMIESLKLANADGTEDGVKDFTTVPVYDKSYRDRKILVPYFTPFISPLIPAIMKVAGYDAENLPLSDNDSSEWGLKYANNEVCYPATLIVGDIIKALKSGKYDISKIAVAITQTGGQCRASNYISLIKKALVDAGYTDIPVISISVGSDIDNDQPAFKVNWMKVVPITFHAVLYSDCIAKFYYASVVREKEAGASAKLRDKYLQLAPEVILRRDIKGLNSLLQSAITEFNEVCRAVDTPKVGIVGEIFLKFNPFAQKEIIDWLIGRKIEVVPPILADFFMQGFVNRKVNTDSYIKNRQLPEFIYDWIYKFVKKQIDKINETASKFRYFAPFNDIFEEAEGAKSVISLNAQFGEGWLLPAEIVSYARQGVNNVVSLQPFGCIANHIVSRGVEKRIKSFYPDINLLSLDFDSGVSDVNITNRMLLFIDNLKNATMNYDNN